MIYIIPLLHTIHPSSLLLIPVLTSDLLSTRDNTESIKEVVGVVSGEVLGRVVLVLIISCVGSIRCIMYILLYALKDTSILFIPTLILYHTCSAL